MSNKYNFAALKEEDAIFKESNLKQRKIKQRSIKTKNYGKDTSTISTDGQDRSYSRN